MKYILRPRQEEAVDKMVKFVNSKTTKKGIFVYFTSFGKSLVIANVASKFPEKYFINVTTSKELLKQNYDKFISYGADAHLCSASLGSKDVGKITFATIGTLVKQIEFFKDKDVVILVDECDKGSKKGSQLDKFVKDIKNCKLIGTTATPLRLKQGMSGTELKMMNRDRDCIYSSIEDVVQIQEGVAQGYWSPLIYDVKDIDESDLVLNGSGTEYTDDSLKKFSETNDITKRCVEIIKALVKERRKSILLFVPFISDAQKIEKLYNKCKAVYSGMDSKDRDQTINNFLNLELKCVVQCTILGTGFDHPQLDAIVFARPTNSITIWYQGLGRGVRTHKLKKDCKIVDISGNFHKFGRIEDINYEEHKAYGGWAAFSGDRLLTNYPLGNKNVPTKKSLLRYFEKTTNSSGDDVVINFGKYKGKSIKELVKDNQGKNYLAWLIKPETKFNFFGNEGKKIKEAIYEHLKLTPTPPPQPKEDQVIKDYQPSSFKTHKEVIDHYINSKATLKDLNGIF